MAKKRVLIVEDEADTRLAIRGLLESAGYEAGEAADGTAGLAQAERVRPDVILLDVRMPGLDGYEVCRRLKENRATAAIPVIFLTAVQDDALNRLAYGAGGVACLTKPFRLEALVAVIKATIMSAELQAKPKRKEGGVDTDLPCPPTRSVPGGHMASEPGAHPGAAGGEPDARPGPGPGYPRAEHQAGGDPHGGEERVMVKKPERRRVARLAVPSHLGGVKLGLRQARLLDLSSEGARIAHPGRLHEGLVSSVELPPALEGLRLAGEVVWSKLRKGEQTPEDDEHYSYQSGLAFIRITVEQLAALAVALAILKTGEGPAGA
jgi:CheY-like chemotaxis protein